MLKQRGVKLGVIVYGESSGIRGTSIQCVVKELDAIENRKTVELLIDKWLHGTKGCIGERASQSLRYIARLVAMLFVE